MVETANERYFDGGDALNGVVAWDTGLQRRRPGILVIHGGSGLDDHARGRARRFAEAGYIAFACDMYGENITGNRERVIRQIGELRRDRAAITSRAHAAIDRLMAHDRIDGRVAVVGYCLGGMVALELARAGLDLAGVVSVHGSLTTIRPAESDSIKSRILVCHGALDPHSPMTDVAVFADEMNRAGADYQLIVYGGAQHGFTHESAIQPANGVAYSATADARSQVAIQTFLNELFAG